MHHLFIMLFIYGRLLSMINTNHINNDNPTWIILKNRHNRLEFVDLTEKVSPYEVEEDEVTFYYTSSVMKDMIAFQRANVSKIVETGFDPTWRTAFVVHGWNNDWTSPMNVWIPAALKQADNWNIFVVDWSGPANHFYTTAKAAVPSIGDILAKFVTELLTVTQQSLATVSFVGHSLGAHVCGQAGSQLDGKVSVIVGLDPASPLYSYYNLQDRLDPADANYVQVIHTNGGKLAFEKPLGHSDFYPNGGEKQNGCGHDWLGICSHSRSHMYFSESILMNKFRATLCDNYDHYKEKLCDLNHVAYMGGNHIDSTAVGLYFLDTASQKPFALG